MLQACGFGIINHRATNKDKELCHTPHGARIDKLKLLTSGLKLTLRKHLRNFFDHKPEETLG